MYPLASHLEHGTKPEFLHVGQSSRNFGSGPSLSLRILDGLGTFKIVGSSPSSGTTLYDAHGFVIVLASDFLGG